MRAVPDPVYLPLRVFVRGASTVGWFSPMAGPRSDLGFPRVIERELVRDGRPAQVRSVTTGGRPTSEVVREWERDVVGWSPDVVIYMVGHYETLHPLWPNWLERHANNFTWLPRRLGTAYRKRVLRPLWRALVKFQTAVDLRVPRRLTLGRIDNAVADIMRVAEKVREIQSPLVVIMQTPLPGSYARQLFPGMEERVRYLNGQLEKAVAAFGSDEVTVFETPAVVEELVGDDRDRAVPDGFHFTGEAHDAVGRRPADQIRAWAADKPHLAPLD